VRSTEKMQKLTLTWLIDDDEVAQYLHRQILKESDFSKEVVSYHYAGIALESLRSIMLDSQGQFPQLILLDINMPNINGWQLLDELASSNLAEKLSTTVFVLLTSSLDEEKWRNSASHDFTLEYLQKPLTHTALKEIIEKHFHELV